MPGGYMGKILYVNLTTGAMKEETPDEKFWRAYIGGHGVGARILYSQQKAGVDALGPDNILGFVTGPFTGTPHPVGTRYQVVCKSPLTGGWGDANSGGFFGSYLKFAGYDDVFVTGIASRPVLLLIDNGKAELKDARKYWGTDSNDTEDALKAEYGNEAEVSCIGQSGEKLSLISCVMNRKGCAAGRSGVGAVMGAKRLKAVVVKGNRDVPLANKEAANDIRGDMMTMLRTAVVRGEPWLASRHKYGTSQSGLTSALSGDSPIKNWGGSIADYKEGPPKGLSGDAAIANLEKREGCWHCPIMCEGVLKAGTGEYKYKAGNRRPEYETQAAFGSMCLVNDTEAVAMANDICNRYGLDTISAGTVVSFAMECYEKGLIKREDLGGIELTWGNHRSMIAVLEMMARREGFGDVLADGVKKAAERIGKGADQLAVHVGGQELGMHDPKFNAFAPGRPAAARYQMDATPGRHTASFGPWAFQTAIVNATGICSFVNQPLGEKQNKIITDFMNAVTGWNMTEAEVLKAGERIYNMRHAFNLREGINEMKWGVHPRIIGKPQLTAGPVAGITADLEAQTYWNLGALDWDRVTTKPSKAKLLDLGLDDVAKDMYP
jgi:aldehyde:ferredoxin oxidoreductase